MNPEGYKKQIFQIDSEEQFSHLALYAYGYQFEHCAPYREFCALLHKTPDKVTGLSEIPFLPIQFFKSRKVADERSTEKIFRSSGTTGQQRSTHYVNDLGLYKESLIKSFERSYGNPQDYIFLALLPGYIERDDASLIYMAKQLMQLSGHPLNGFYMDQYHELEKAIIQALATNKKVLLLGVTFALLELAEKTNFNAQDAIIMETGGMKGKRKELTRAELHELLKQQFHVDQIHSEYGMTELLSQSYSSGAGKYTSPPWMKVLTSNIQDPYDQTSSGRINVIDLANIHSCCFIATDDLGVIHANNSFEVTGRMDHSEWRGCNLMMN